LEVPQYTEEDFLTPEPYRYVLSISNPFEREMEINRLSVLAKPFGFKTMLKRFQESQKAEDKTIYIDNVTRFTGQPMELDCGGWKCDDWGISRRTGMGEELACCHPIMPVERLVNIDTGLEKLRIAYSKGGKWRDSIAEKRILASANSIVSLSDMGIAVNSENARSLVRYISEIENINYDSIPERKSVGRLGYIKDAGFSPYMKDLIFDGDANYRSIFTAISRHGTSKAWLEIATECRQMSLTARIMLAASFASVLVEPLGAQPFFVHLWGVESGTGKTVALLLAASVWGDPSIGKYVQTFNATAVSQEKTAAFLNSLPLLVDELQLAKDSRGKIAFNVYNLAQGVGKSRGNKSGGIDRTPTWANCILTTGESPLTSIYDGAGALNRVIDIECTASDYVIADGMRVSGILKKNYGHAGKAFVDKILKDELKEDIKNRHQEIFKKLLENDTTEKQALAAAMILLADELITKWFFGGGAPISIQQISSFLQTKASVSAGERGYQYICEWVAQNHNKFDNPDSGDVYGAIDGNIAYIIPKAFRDACEAGGFSYAALMSHMKQNNLIKWRGDRNTWRRRMRNMNIECIALVLLGEEDDDYTKPDQDIEMF